MSWKHRKHLRENIATIIQSQRYVDPDDKTYESSYSIADRILDDIEAYQDKE